MVGAILILLLGTVIILETPFVQKKVSDKVTALLNDAIDGRVSCTKITLLPFNALAIDDLTILDTHYSPADTFARIGHLSATFSIAGLLANEGIHLGRLRLKDIDFHLITESEKESEVSSNLQRIFGLKKPEGPKPQKVGPDIFNIRVARAENLHFRLTSLIADKSRYKGKGMNYADLDVRAKLKAHRIKFGGGLLTASVDRLDLSEKCGYKNSTLRGRLRVGLGKTLIENLRIKDEMSDVYLPWFSMNYANSFAFRTFVNDVSFNARIENSVLDYATVQAFAFQLPHCRLKAKIKCCDVNGPVNDLDVKNMVFTDLRSGVNGTLDCRITGVAPIPQNRNNRSGAPNFALDATVKELYFTGKSITTFLDYYAPKLNFTFLKPGHSYKFSGKCTGFLQKLNINGEFKSDVGSAGTRLQVRNAANKNLPIELEGSFHTERFNIGKALGVNSVGECTMQAKMRGSFAKARNSIILDSLHIRNINALEYDYSNISASGRYVDNIFDGTVKIDDPCLKFLYRGELSIPKKGIDPTYQFTADLGFADLYALNLDKRAEASAVAFKIISDYKNVGQKKNAGEIRIQNIRLSDAGGMKELGNIDFNIISEEKRHNIKMLSSFADANFNGEQSIFDFLKDLRALSADKVFPSLKSSSDSLLKFSNSNYKASITFHDSRRLLAYAFPGMYIADSTRIAVNVGNTGELKVNMNTGRLALGKNYLKNAVLEAHTSGDSLIARMSNEEFKYGNLFVKKGAISARAHTDTLEVRMNYDAQQEGNETYGMLGVNSYFYRDKQDSLFTVIHALPSSIKTMGTLLDIQESRVTVSEGNIRVDSLNANLDGHKMSIAGGISFTKKDSLSLDIDALDLNLLSKLANKNFTLNGFVSCKANIISPLETTEKASAEICIDSLEVNGNKFNKIIFDAGWDKEKSGVRMVLSGADSDNNNPDAMGLWVPGKSFNLETAFSKLNMAIIQPFVSNSLSELNGFVNGKIMVSSKEEGVHISSENTSVQDLEATIMTTGVHYKINGDINLSDDGIKLTKVEIEDKEGGKGRIDGQMTIDKENSIFLDAAILASGLQVLDVEQAMGKDLSGRLKADGNLHISGPLKNLDIEGSVGTRGKGSIYLSTGRATAVKASDLLSFTEDHSNDDPYEQMLNDYKVEKKTGGKVNLKIQASINNETEAVIKLDKSSGNTITASGNGLIGIDYRSNTGKMVLTGDYTMEKGKFRFEIPGIVNKDFNLVKGSRIKFNGDVMESDLGINGVYNMKTSLSTLIADSTASNRRPVECLINISGKLSNPMVEFDVNVKDLDPAMKSQVETALNTDDKKQKQFIALLVMGSFLPNEQSGVMNSSNILFSNVSEIMSGQLNSIFQKLDIPVDLGVGYQQTSNGKNMFDVAISTQLFNNRVIVDGTVGNRQYKASGNSESVVGDLNIEVKLDRPGNFRVKLFSHSADEHTSFLDYSQRNGIGISVQKEFDSLGDLFRSIFASHKKSEEMKLKKMEKDKEKTKLTINE